jgi:hypothetical protein
VASGPLNASPPLERKPKESAPPQPPKPDVPPAALPDLVTGPGFEIIADPRAEIAYSPKVKGKPGKERQASAKPAAKHPSHVQIRRQLDKRAGAFAGSEAEMDKIEILDASFETPSPFGPPKGEAAPRSDANEDLPMALIDSQVGIKAASSPPSAPVALIDSAFDIGEIEEVEAVDEPAGPAAKPPTAVPASIADLDDEPLETPSKKKRRKKRKDGGIAEMIESRGNFLVAMAMVGLTVLIVLIGLGVSFWKGQSPPPDPAQAIAALKQHGARIERDPNQPGEPVISVVLAGTDVSTAEIVHLKAFTKLQRLNLSHTNINAIAVDHIAQITSIRWLDLNSTNIGDGATDSLGQMTNLEHLYLNNTRVTDLGLEKLRGLKKLKELGLEGSMARGDALAAALPGLKLVR